MSNKPKKLSWQIAFNIQSIQKGARNYGKGFLFDHAAASLFPHNANEMMKYLAYMSTKVFNYALETINPTINTGADVVGRLPVCDSVPDFAGSNAEKCVKSSKNNSSKKTNNHLQLFRAQVET